MGLLALVAPACAPVAGSTPTSTVAVPTATPTPVPPPPTATPIPRPTPSPTPVLGRPQRLRIPRIAVDAPVVPVGITPAGEIEPPPGPHLVGWYAGSPMPGAPGNSLLTGHLDWRTETAVFWRLRELEPGDLVEVETDGGNRLTFRVESTRAYPVQAAPVAQILGYAIGRVLTLITCEGTFDRQTRDYSHRRVVRARLS